MKRGLVYTIGAAAAVIFGLGFLLIPAQVMGLYGIKLELGGLFICRYFGSALVGVAVILWGMRKATSIKESESAVTTGMLILTATGLIVAIWNGISGVANTLVWLNTVVYGLLTIGFGWLFFKK